MPSMAERRSWLTIEGVVNGIVITLGTLALFALLLLTFSDVLTRNLFNAPIPGAQEVSENWLMVILVATGIWWSSVVRDHIRVTLLTETIGPNTFKLVEIVVTLASVALLLRMAQLGLISAIASMQEGEYTGAYNTIVWPLRYLLTAAFFGYAVVLVIHLVNLLTGKTRPQEEPVGSPEDMI